MKNRLRLIVAATTSLVLAAFVVPLGLLLRSQAEDRAMVTASLRTQSVAAQVLAADPIRLRSTVDQLNSRQGWRVTVFLPGGDIVGAPVRADKAVELARRGLSFATDTRGGREFLVPVQGLPGGTAVIRTLVSDQELHRGVTGAWLALGAIAVLLLVFAVVLGDILGRALVRPLGNLLEVVNRLAAGELAARAAPDGPGEVHQLALGVNALADRVRVLLTTERKETTEFAQRLRTAAAGNRQDPEMSHPSGPMRLDPEMSHPSGAMRLDPEMSHPSGAMRLPGTEAAAPAPPAPPAPPEVPVAPAAPAAPAFGSPEQSQPSFRLPERPPAFGPADRPADRPDAFAPGRPQAHAPEPPEAFGAVRRPAVKTAGRSCDLAAVTVERARSWSGVAEESGRELQVMTAPAPVAVRASREDVEAVIDALVGNVFAHTPDGTPMWILAEPTEGGGRLIVEDAGPGFNDIDLAAQRRTGGIPAGSTGSGLAVSRRVAESAGGELTLAGRRGGGAQVVVDLG